MVKIPEGWIETTLGEVCNSITETYKGHHDNVFLVNTSDVLEGKIIVNNLSENKDLKGQFKKTFKKDDILYSEIRPANKRYAFVNTERTDNYIASTKLMVIRSISDKILPKFLYLLLTSSSFITEMQYLAESRSGTFPQITFGTEIARYRTIIPSLPEQQAIASVLSSLDDKIELLREENQTLEEMGQTLFKERFGKYKVGDELPEGWRWGLLTDVADFLNGIALQKYPAIEGEPFLPVIKIREMKQGITNETDKASSNIDSKYIVENRDVIFSWSGSLELVFWKFGKGALNQHLFKVTSEKYPKRFYYFWILHHLPEFRSIAQGKATTMGHIQRGHLDSAKVIIPDNISLVNYDKIMSKIIDKIFINNEEIQTLQNSRDQLLPKLMSGEVRVEF